MSSDMELTRLAASALLKEAVLGATRASIAGPSGWKRPHRCAPNKTFLTNTIRGAVASNKIREAKLSERSNKKKVEVEAICKGNSRYKKKYLTASTKIPARSDGPKYYEEKATEAAAAAATKPRFNVNDVNSIEKNPKNTGATPGGCVDHSKSCVVWTDEEALELRPVTKERRNAYNKEKAILRAKRKLRSLNFVAARNTT